MIIEKGIHKAELFISHLDWEFLYANPQIKEVMLVDSENSSHIIKVMVSE